MQHIDDKPEPNQVEIKVEQVNLGAKIKKIIFFFNKSKSKFLFFLLISITKNERRYYHGQ